LAEENSVESMRASMYSIVFLIFCFHWGGMILRTGSLHRFESASGVQSGAEKTSCGNVAANPRRSGRIWGLTLFYPSGGHKPMVLQRF
jgi:hypothetical protein